MTSGQTLYYENDVFGRRTSTSDASGDYNSYYYGAGGNTEAVCLYPYSANLTYNILGAGGDNIGQVKVANGSVSGRYYYLKDHLGSIRMTVDVNGNPVGWDDYYPYGMQMTGRSYTSSADQRYKFTGKERDASTGLDYFGKRYYDSWKGGWDQVDPMQDKYPGWSSYNYVTDNPERNVDPDGNDLSDFYDLEGHHKHIDDNDKNAYLTTTDNINKVNTQNAEEIKRDNLTTNLGKNSDLVALADLVFNEARGEKDAVQMAIAFTFINRSKIMGTSIEHEVFKPKQSSFIDRWKNLSLENASTMLKSPLIQSYNSAMSALIINNYGISPIGYNVTHFYSPSSPTDRPWWGDRTKEIELPSPFNEGNFIFYHNLPPY